MSEPRAPLRIVVAEDDAIIRMDLCAILEEQGYEVVADVGQGDLAVEAVRQHEPDVAVLDVKMPVMDGITAAGEIASERLCAVVLLTAFSQRKLIEDARDAGVMAYLVKPFQPEELMPAIEMAVGRYVEMAALADRSATLEEQLETRKLTDRAKAVLMNDHGLSEVQAFRFLQRGAMDRRSTMKAIAQAVVDGELTPT
ncbi:MAG: response regulator [Microthrixaceae bacterium]|nr:response regulator [Microthrixaceae bacterium]